MVQMNVSACLNFLFPTEKASSIPVWLLRKPEIKEISEFWVWKNENGGQNFHLSECSFGFIWYAVYVYQIFSKGWVACRNIWYPDGNDFEKLAWFSGLEDGILHVLKL
jgi:hypothetical protein